RFPISMWNYRTIAESSPDEVMLWAECGLTHPMTPRTIYGQDAMAVLLPYLDRAEKSGLRLIANIGGLEYNHLIQLGADAYEKRFREVCDVLRHPALYGFFIGDEPGDARAFEACVQCIEIQKKVAAEQTPYVNFHTNMNASDPEILGGRTFREWLRYFRETTGCGIFGYGNYDHMVNENGFHSYFRELREMIGAAEQAGIDCWNTQLSSAHYHFRIPNEYDMMWQLTTAAACGSRGVTWFRFYDRPAGPNYHGSPVDEYGNKTETYYRMLRANRRFNDQYGRILMELHRKNTFMTGKSYGGYPLFEKGMHPVITDVSGTGQAIVSFFEDSDRNEYLCVVNSSMENPEVFRPEFDRKNFRLLELTCNGANVSEYTAGTTADHWDGQWLYPGQMCLYRITAREAQT
ncbi:MAG: hypothetical protein ACI4V1_02700, partial [Eubacteriales bacterium]